MPCNKPTEHMTREQARHVAVGDVILVGVHKDRPAVVRSIYKRGIAPPYFATTAERAFTSWRLAALRQEPEGGGAD
jgi:hypothetical protein